MTTAKKDAAPALVVRIPLNQIVESKTNPRRIFEDMKDLIESVREKGVLAPIFVRPIGKIGATDIEELVREKNRKFEIVYGARRYRAAKEAALSTIPALVRYLDDREYREIQLIENLQRTDPHPLDEADGIAALLTMEGYTVDLIAEKLGKDRSYIYKRLALASLDKTIKDSFYKGDVNIAQCSLICRLPRPADQLRAFAECFDNHWNGSKTVVDYDKPRGTPASELERFIKREILRELHAAAFPKDDAELFPAAGSCTACTKRTGANASLFGELGNSDQCLDGACFNRKVDAFINISMAKAVESGDDSSLLFVSTDYNSPALPENVLPPGAFVSNADASKTCKGKRKALIVIGNGRGSFMNVCLGKPCEVHSYIGRGSNPNVRKLTFAEQWAEKEKHLNERIAIETSRATLRAIFESRATPEAATLELVCMRMLDDYLRNDGQKIIADLFDIKLDRSKLVSQIMGLKQMAGATKLWPLIMTVAAIAPYGRNSKYLEETAALVGHVDVKLIAKKVAGPMRGTFEASKRKALERSKEKKPAVKQAKTNKPSTPATKKRAAK